MSNENQVALARREATGVVPFSTTLLVRDTCLCLHVQRAARVLARRFDEALKPAGLTNGQFSLLMSLNRPVGTGEEPAGERGTGASTGAAAMRDVAKLLAMDRTTLTAAVKTLERRGLLVVLVDGADRRAKRLRLTAQGRSTLAGAVPIWKQEHGELEREIAGAGRDVAGLLGDLRWLAR